MYVTNMLQAVSGSDLKWEDYIGVAMYIVCFMAATSKVQLHEFCDG